MSTPSFVALALRSRFRPSPTLLVINAYMTLLALSGNAVQPADVLALLERF